MELVKEVHTLIVWSKASDLNTQTKELIESQFDLVGVYVIEWNKSNFIDNLKVFYAHSQKHRTESEFHNTLENKIKHCGDDAFTLYVYQDGSPNYDFRITSSGNREVNTNAFDLKASLRVLSGGGHKIHGSDNTFESNKDLTLLFGLNTVDFLKKCGDGTSVPLKIESSCIGVGGYASIQQLFYVLNNTINYCVLRNFECFPENYTLAEHGDIDLLVEDLNYIKYLTLAKSYYPELDYRVHYGIVISNELIPFDFRFLGDNYYDFNWQSNILKTSIWFKNFAKVPDAVNYFYGLLYHAYVQKKEIKSDYKVRLEVLAKNIGLTYTKETSTEEVKTLLDHFMSSNKYCYTLPLDKTVFFNAAFLNADNSRNKQFGTLISVKQARLENEMLYTEVYDNGTEITKIGSRIIIESEIKFLQKLAPTGLVPRVIKTSLEDNNCYVVMEKLPGTTLDEVQNNKEFWKIKNIKSLIRQLIHLNAVLIQNEVLHRDVRPPNIMVTFDKQKNIHLKWIDFGWATDFSSNLNLPTPLGLGGKQKYGVGQYSDLYSTGKIITTLFKKLSFKSSVAAVFDVAPSLYNSVNLEQLKEKMDVIDAVDSYVKFTALDYLKIFILKNKSIVRFLKAIKKAF